MTSAFSQSKSKCWWPTCPAQYESHLRNNRVAAHLVNDELGYRMLVTLEDLFASEISHTSGGGRFGGSRITTSHLIPLPHICADTCFCSIHSSAIHTHFLNTKDELGSHVCICFYFRLS